MLGDPQMATPFFLNALRPNLMVSIREVERWPANARAQAWRVMGQEIDELTEIFETERTRVLAMEQKLAKCVDDMQAARECTEVLPHLVYLVNAAAADALNS